MGLGYEMVEALVREHAHRPLAGNVVTIGKQTIYFQPQEIMALLREHGHSPALGPDDLQLDRSTVGRRHSHAGLDLISDSALFALLGVPRLLAIDHSDYEGADIIHDLTKPLPDALRGFADFVVDGSTLDNTFDPARTITNFVDFLKPGGRLLMINQYSNHHNPYVMLPPLWYLDYFAMNRFVDCKVYIVLYPQGTRAAAGGHSNAFCIDLRCLLDKERQVSTFVSDWEMGVIVLAEKGTNSTSHIYPSQQHYRPPEESETYRANLAVIAASARPHLVRTRGSITFKSVSGGHLFIDNEFNACDPTSAIRRSSGTATTVASSARDALRRICHAIKPA